MDGDDNLPPPLESTSNLRHRPAAAARRNEDDASAAFLPKPETAAVATSQLAEARRIVAERVRQQMLEDGEEPWDGEVEAGMFTEAWGSTPEPGQGKRRGSSVAASEEEGEAVRAMLRGQRPPAAEGKEEDQADPLGDEGPDPLAPGAFEEAPPRMPDERPADGQPECRICFDGEDPDLGRLFSPCSCRGTARFVHVACLDRWRARSAGLTSFYKCDQCGYEYKLRRTRISGLAQNRLALGTLTFICFTLLIFISGFVADSIIRGVENRSASLQLTGAPFEDLFAPEWVIVGESAKEVAGFFEHTIDEGWRALTGEGGGDGDDVDEGDPEEKDDNLASRFFKSVLRESAKAKAKEKVQQEEMQTWSFLRRWVQHGIKGMSLLGIASFFQSFFATALFGPFGFRGTLFRAVRPARRNGDNQASISQLVIAMVVLVGIYKAVSGVYRGVKWLSKRMLKRVEGLVMDV